MNLSWIKKMAKYFKDENVHEEAPEQPGLYQARPDKIDTRVAYHYPKKQFRFPVIPDQEGARRKTAEKPEKQRPRAKKHRPEPQSERSEKVQKGHPFRPTDIPSPVFGFKRPTNDSAQEETTVLEYELEDHYKKDIRLLDMAKLQQLLDFAENPGTDGERNLTTPEHGMADQLFEEKKMDLPADQAGRATADQAEKGEPVQTETGRGEDSPGAADEATGTPESEAAYRLGRTGTIPSDESEQLTAEMPESGPASVLPKEDAAAVSPEASTADLANELETSSSYTSEKAEAIQVNEPDQQNAGTLGSDPASDPAKSEETPASALENMEPEQHSMGTPESLAAGMLEKSGISLADEPETEKAASASEPEKAETDPANEPEKGNATAISPEEPGTNPADESEQLKAKTPGSDSASVLPKEDAAAVSPEASTAAIASEPEKASSAYASEKTEAILVNEPDQQNAGTLGFNPASELSKEDAAVSQEASMADLANEPETPSAYASEKTEKNAGNEPEQRHTEMAGTSPSSGEATKTERRPRKHLPFNVLMLKQDRRRITEKKEAPGPRPEQENPAENSGEKPFSFPPLSLLEPPVKQTRDEEWIKEQSYTLDEALENFNVRAKVVNASQGPSVTRFEVQPEPGVKVNKITNLNDDLKLSLAAKDIRIEAPIPGKHTVGIEIPNLKSRPVRLREIIGDPVFQNSKSPLTVAMGLDISGKPVVTDLQKMPHGLIAGATGSGKSVCINSVLVSLLYKAAPQDLKLLLIDPKMVELAPYNQIPHLVSPVITDVKMATAALKWAVEEMERRYELFAHESVRDIHRYNEMAVRTRRFSEKLPYIVIVIDELADLMMTSPGDVEDAICRIAQKARACGIHLILATQRPSVDVITGLIKANIPTRIAFSVSSHVDSRTIIDMSGAEKLLGKGDMLFLENGTSKPVRLQGTFVSDREIDDVVSSVRETAEPEYLFQPEELLRQTETGEEEDELFPDACEFVIHQGGASTSLLQRNFRIGYNRAARLIDMMEQQGIISGAKGSKPRDVLITKSEFMQMQEAESRE
ncbi:MAG: DNA translocase FtsK [Heyndrickxia faecalis]|jgi:S-DNA-T family DNA segregation ATPase FtsK/SpoIIIE|uniref:DNA translocase FtsK n=1 Tax=Heyndrickxia TaxID=2837504 RepID=UPI001459DF02|nr:MULTISPECIES: DNA translocase FtsK [Heyndrickxia]MED4322265.1 DNA translocase FtsK [Weizmannia sp. CD-2023]MED4922439.1 DNA translocase FtsK [Weizmannia sp. CD-2023]NMH85707.1 DNA translocase FtsK [Heyndrickxia coagulans]UXC21500.1 DNA translocase FtsK [Heyndrickxia coagulans]